MVGWVNESPGRGTLSLITACIFTIFLCTWVVIHPRVEQRPVLRVMHKFALFLKTVIAPEFIAVEGLQEWSQARKTVEICSKPTSGQLKFVHAFYVGMLALRYRTPRGSRVIWPNQYAWLLEQRLIDWVDHESWGMAEETIKDKSNADGTVKLAAIVQVSWFVAQSVMRTVHGLPLSQLESMTLSYIPLFIVTYFFWWLKPKDITTPSMVNLPNMAPEQQTTFESMAVSSKFDDEGIGQQGSIWTIWHLTPRVFEKEAEDKAAEEAARKVAEEKEKKRTKEMSNQARDEDVEQGHPRGKAGNTKSASTPVVTKSKQHVVAYWDPDLYRSRLWPITCLFGASFGALHLISWNTAFPTTIEQWLWRAAALTSVVSMLVFMQFEKVVLRWGGPFTLISLVSPVLYLLSRIVMVALVIAAFRAEDPAVYDTYVVSNYWVHIL